MKIVVTVKQSPRRYGWSSTRRPLPGSGSGTVWQNVVSGMGAYGLIDDNGILTDIGSRLYDLRHDLNGLYNALAQHLLNNVKGVTLIECLLDMHRAGEVPTLPAIREALEERGVHTSTAGKSISLLRLWLAKAGLFRSQWVPNTDIYHGLLGKSKDEIAAMAGLGDGQRAVLKMLATLGDGHYDSSDLRHAAEAAYSVSLNEKTFAQDVIYKLGDLGYLNWTRKGGRGWTLDVQTTPKTLEVTVELVDQLSGLSASLRSLVRMNVPDIVARLDSEDTYQKGLALEALGFKLMRIVGLDYISTRFRPRPGRFEVDLLFQSDRLAYSRWQIQCKNTDRVSVDDVAKEVGLTYHLLSNVIVVLTRGVIGEDARRYASDVMRKTNLAIALVDKTDVTEIVSNPLAIFPVLKREASYALELKPLQPAD